jgi:succinate-semialdehyde dehydrogenase/glutarate-semialdehyde dehydrogenase
MELGGNAPFVVLDDANIEDAVKGLMLAKMRNGGAACTAANRIYVARSIGDKFIAEFARAMSSMKMGVGREAGITLGASVSMKERNKIAELVEGATSRGAKVHAGATTPDGPGAFYPPTVIEVPKDDAILAEEVFGPVAPVVLFDTDEEALKLANDTEYGLISYVYSEDLKRAIRFAEGIEAGMVGINRGLLSDPAAPFGGVKQSGLGREGGFDGIHEFLQTKYIGVEI